MKNRKIRIAILSLVCLAILIGIGFGIILPKRQMAIAQEQTETQFALATADEIALIDGMTATANVWTKTPTPTNTFTPTVTSTPTNTPTITPTLGIGSTRMRESDGMVQVYVPEGEFTMGRNGHWPVDEPEHNVYLTGYWIDQTEMTNSRYMMCVEAGVCSEPLYPNSYNTPNFFGNEKYDNFPVVYMRWDQANAYCEWVGADLPTEAQWEKAARGTDGRMYAWGNQEPKWNLGNVHEFKTDSVEVGSYPLGASPYGALDMTGNVDEWVKESFDWNYYENSPYENPPGAEINEEKQAFVPMTRGGLLGDPTWVFVYLETKCSFF